MNPKSKDKFQLVNKGIHVKLFHKVHPKINNKGSHVFFMYEL